MFERTLSVPAADRPRAPLVARSGGLSNALGVERVMGIEPIGISRWISEVALSGRLGAI